MAAFFAASASVGCAGEVAAADDVLLEDSVTASVAMAAASAAFLAAWAAAALANFSAFSAFSRSSRNCLNSKRSLAWSAAFFSRSRAQISLLAKRKYWTSGMREGQTN